MRRINLIFNDPDFLSYVHKIQEAEADRIYCRHDMPHFLDVSRIAYIVSLEENLDIGKEIIYAAGLLHDIGRWMEYESGVDHAIASKELAADILRKYDFSETEIGEILIAVERHRNGTGSSLLADILYRADKLSRNCIFCEARTECKRFRNGEDSVLFNEKPLL
jgi:putative nucleotidyltransferase with HDIG domain